ncbi:STAS domain-containing protein [Sporosarcina koreensis]|uniref:STAS domain-containing protein n=1 Tax=Sporosarcina koreensis TaxID=334735 RepID=UPI00058F56A8|nr:STAS domain-containing protein [Sporosarcina koreensis]
MNPTEEIRQLKEKIANYEEIISETSVPIIPSIVENTILLPITGHTDQSRFERIRSTVLAYTGDHRDIEYAVFDFSGLRLDEEDGPEVMTAELRLMQAELQMMGVRPLMVGFTPPFVRELTNAGVADQIESYANFKGALQVLMKENGLSFARN